MQILRFAQDDSLFFHTFSASALFPPGALHVLARDYSTRPGALDPREVHAEFRGQVANHGRHPWRRPADGARGARHRSRVVGNARCACRGLSSARQRLAEFPNVGENVARASHVSRLRQDLEQNSITS